MREIKFRGKSLDNGVWEYGDLIENQGRFFIYHATSETTIEDNDDGRIVVAAVEVDPATVGQYTGLTDGYRKMIFEGDVVERTVYMRNYAECDGENVDRFEVQYDEHELLPFSECGVNMEEYEVIGNIHDNPELLKGGEE